MTTSPEQPSREERFERVLADYLRRVDEGLDVDRTVLIAENADLAEDLASFFRNHDAVERIAQPLRAGSSSGDDPTLGLAGDPSVDPNRVRYIGDYELLEEIARGGMGVVYRARQRSLQRLVALKMILAGQLASESDVERFHQEAEHAANLDHPHIVPIYEIGVHEGRHYFSMRLIEGSNLRSEMPRLRADLPAGVKLLCEAARAVHHAHQRGVLHRDLKPSNILIDADGAPHVTDFGLAKRVEGESDLTQSGAIVGTPSYMAPEQARGEKQISTAADVHGLGAMLYELLVGRPPYQGPTPVETLVRVVSEEPQRPSLTLKNVDRDLETIALKCLEKDPQRRYDSAAAMADDLDRWRRGEPILARAVGRRERTWRWCRRNPAVAGLVATVTTLLLVGIVVSTYFASIAARNAELAQARAAEAQAEKERAEEKAAEARRERERAEKSSEAARAHAANAVAEKARADTKAAEAIHESLAAEAARLEAERNLYVAQMNLVQRAWEQGHVPQMRMLLERQQPAGFRDLLAGAIFRRPRSRAERDLRGFEWYYWQRRLNSDVMSLHSAISPVAHLPGAYAVAYSPGGTLIATGGYDNLVHIWNANTGGFVRTLRGHKDVVKHVAFSPDGSRLASVGGAFDGVKVWSLADGKLLYTFVSTSGDVTGLNNQCAFSPDGSKLAVAAYLPVIKVWNLTDGAMLPDLKGHNGGAAAVAFSPDGTLIATMGTQDKTVRILDVADGREIRMLRLTWLQAGDLKFSPDGKRLAAGDWGGVVQIWNVVDGKPFNLLRGPSTSIYAIAYSPDGKRLAVAGEDQVLRIWDVARNEVVLTIRGHIYAVHGIAFSPDGARIATASTDGRVKIWDAVRGQEPPELQAPNDALNCLTVDRDGRLAAAAGFGGKIQLWDISSRRLVKQLRENKATIHCAAFHPDGKLLAVGGDDDVVRLWDVAAGKVQAEWTGHRVSISSLAFSNDGKLLVSGGQSWPDPGKSLGGAQVKLWNVAEGRVVKTIDDPKLGISSVTIHPDGGRLAYARRDLSVIVCDATSGKEQVRFQGQNNFVSVVVYSPDGKLLATAAYDKTVKLWDAATGRELQTLNGHADGVTCMTFSTDGRRLATGGRDCMVKVWDTASGQETLSLAGHSNYVVNGVAFTPDGRNLVSLGLDGTLRIWDAEKE